MVLIVPPGIGALQFPEHTQQAFPAQHAQAVIEHIAGKAQTTDRKLTSMCRTRQLIPSVQAQGEGKSSQGVHVMAHRVCIQCPGKKAGPDPSLLRWSGRR